MYSWILKVVFARTTSVVVMKLLCIGTFALTCAWVHGAGLQAQHIVTRVSDGFKNVEVGQWTEDELGRYRFDVDDWTEIVNPVQGLVWRANSKRGRYSKKNVLHPKTPMGSPLIDTTVPFVGPDVYEINRIDLGSRMIDGVLCEGTLVNYDIALKNRKERVELEAWRTEEFIFPFNMVFKVRTKESEQITEIRDVVTMTEAELEGRFMPEPHWRESRFLVVRTNMAWTGFWPFTKSGSKVTGTMMPWPIGRQEKDPRHLR